jgi:hypothetical protein
MASDNPGDWMTAREQYIDELLERFPQGKLAVHAAAFIDKIDIEQAKRQFELSQRLGREPPTVAGRRYFDAWRKYEEGEPEAALEKYQQLVAEIPAEGEEAPFVKLARQQVAAIKAELAAMPPRPAADAPVAAEVASDAPSTEAVESDTQQSGSRQPASQQPVSQQPAAATPPPIEASLPTTTP